MKNNEKNNLYSVCIDFIDDIPPFRCTGTEEEIKLQIQKHIQDKYSYLSFASKINKDTQEFFNKCYLKYLEENK